MRSWTACSASRRSHASTDSGRFSTGRGTNLTTLRLGAHAQSMASYLQGTLAAQLRSGPWLEMKLGTHTRCHAGNACVRGRSHTAKRCSHERHTLRGNMARVELRLQRGGPSRLHDEQLESIRACLAPKRCCKCANAWKVHWHRTLSLAQLGVKDMRITMV